MIRKILKSVALAAAISAVSLGAGAEETLNIGVIGPLSGGGTAWGLAITRGTQMAMDKINASGGLKVGDKQYKLKEIAYDDRYSSAGGRVAAERLVNSDKVKFIIGPIGSPSVLSVVPIANENKVLMISDGFANSILANKYNAAYNFRGMDSNQEFGPAMVKWYHEHFPDAKKVALIAPNDSVGQQVVPQLAKEYQKNGFTVWTELYERGTKEFTPLLTRMIAQKVDLLDLNSNAPDEAGLLLKQARQTGYTGKIWQVGGPSVDEVMHIAGPLAEGFMSLDVFDFRTDEGKAFVDQYDKKYGKGVINAQTPVWYNAALMLFEAIRRAGTTDTDKVRDSLVNLTGFTPSYFGGVKWGGKAIYGVDHQLMMPFWIVKVEKGKVVTLDKVVPVDQ